MNSDLENIPPSLGLLPIRKLSSLIPLRKASRYHLSDPRDGSAFPALKTSTNTFQSSIPVKVAERRVPDDGRVVSKAKKEKLSTKTKMAMAPKPTATYAKLPASLAVHTTPRLPMSPPPEEELREQEKSRRKSSVSQASRPSPTQSSGGSRKRARSPSPNPKARKFPKLQQSKPGISTSEYLVPLKSSQDGPSTQGRKSRGSEPAARPQSTTKANEGSKKDSRRRSSPAPSRRGSVSHSRPATPSRRASGARPTTPIIIRTVPPPDINSLPPPAPPSPSDDPLWMPPPPPRRRADGSIIYSSRKRGMDDSVAYEQRRASTSYRAVSPTPAPRARPSAPISPLINMDDDVSMMDAEPIWDNNDVPSGTDFVVPLNFDSSRSPRASVFRKSPSSSPCKDTPVRARPGSPWLRGNAEDASAQDKEAMWAPLQDAPSDSESEQEVDLPEENGVPIQDASPVAEELLVEQQSRENQSALSSPSRSPGGFAGMTLSQRFAELSNKLATEGRSFRQEPTFRRSLSAIGAMPSSDGAEPVYDQAELKFPDLPSSSPEKAVEEEPEENVEDSEISGSVEQEEESERYHIPRQEEPAESGLNEYSSQVDAEDTTPVEQPKYEVEQPQYSFEQESAESALESGEHSVPTAEPSRELIEAASGSWESSGDVAATAAVELQTEESSVWHTQPEAISASPAQSQAVNGIDNEDASFISPIRVKDSPLMDVTSVHSDDSDTESEDEDMDESGQAAESTYEQDIQQQSYDIDIQQEVQVSATMENEPKATPGSWRRVSDEGIPEPEIREDHTLEYDEEAEDEMACGPSWEDETDAEPIVQIRSHDPMAAARAAAILNLHHEYIQGTPKRQDSSSVWASSSRRRSTSVMRTPVIEAQAPRSSQLFATPSRRGGDTGQLAPSPVIQNTATKSEWRRLETPANARVVLDWTKREWRCLEQCFTDVRMETAQALDVDDIDPEEVDLDDVVARFVETYGTSAKLEGEWKWEKMRRRAYALVNRQREGSARGLASAISSPTPSMFTPARPTVATAPVIRTVPDPLGSTSTLHAPRYAHLAYERGVTQSPTPTPQTRPGRTSRDMPPPSYLPARSMGSSRPQPGSQTLYPPLPPQSKPYQIPPSTPLARSVVPEPTSASRKMWNWMGSFLRAGSEQPISENGEPREFIPSLPPISDADREALRHVSPPAPKPKERIVPPKDQVQLQHVPTPVPIRIPRKLNHKGSSGSVKDMIKSFESISDTDSLRKGVSRPFVVKKTSASSLRSMDSSSEWSREQSKSVSQEISVGSVRSVRDMVQNYSPATSQQSARMHVGSFRMGDGTRW